MTQKLITLLEGTHLNRCGIPFFAGNGGQIWTTLDAINDALKLESERPQKAEF